MILHMIVIAMPPNTPVCNLLSYAPLRGSRAQRGLIMSRAGGRGRRRRRRHRQRCHRRRRRPRPERRAPETRDRSLPRPMGLGSRGQGLETFQGSWVGLMVSVARRSIAQQQPGAWVQGPGAWRMENRDCCFFQPCVLLLVLVGLRHHRPLWATWDSLISPCPPTADSSTPKCIPWDRATGTKRTHGSRRSGGHVENIVMQSSGDEAAG